MEAILGVSAFYHDAAAALLIDGEIVCAAQEERFTRRKHDPSFPRNAVRFCLDYAGLSPSDLTLVAFYDKPLLKFERLLETYCAFSPKGLRQFLSAVPTWIKEKLFLKKIITDELRSLGAEGARFHLLFPEHHLSHAASAFYPSPFWKAAILTVDGVGEWATASIGLGEGAGIRLLRELRFPHSAGLLYSAFTWYLGFKVNSGEYKLMGLAPYGRRHSREVEHFTSLIKEHLVRIYPDGSIWLNQDYFDYATGLRMVDEERWERLFGLPRRRPEEEILQEHCDMALSIQQVMEEIVLRMAGTARELTGARQLVMAGGVALNCVANGKLRRSGTFDEIWIQPAAGDAGGALGAALAAWHIHLDRPRTPRRPDAMQGAYLGPEFSSLDIQRTSRKFRARYRRYDDFGRLASKTVHLLAEGRVVGWFQGRMEWGPRALGNRSILADPRRQDMQKRLNLKIKFREGFRPFAPAVLSERVQDYFEDAGDSPYMLLVSFLKKALRRDIPPDYREWDWRRKLYFDRSELPAITHIDFSARIQTVHRATNPRYWHLLRAFEELTGCAVVVNTSFNVRGEPIVCTPEDAYACFMRTGMDVLVMGDFLFLKEEQPRHEAWDRRGEYAPD